MDILDEMTKEEILHWIRGSAPYIIRPPKRSTLLFSRWQLKEKKMSERRRANITRGESLDMSKHDKYAKKFNASKNPNERISLMKKMEPYHKKLNAYLDESKSIMKVQKRIDKMYDQIEVERKKENNYK